MKAYYKNIWLILFSIIFISGCNSKQTIEVTFKGIANTELTAAEKALIIEIAQDTNKEVRKLLPQLTENIRLTVSIGTNILPETGSGGAALEIDHISWIVDNLHRDDISTIAKSNLRSALFHEMHHLTRGWVISGGEPVLSIMDAVVSEGMATVFERDYSGSEPIWGNYPENINEWVNELMVQPASALNKYGEWMFRSSDGRRWIGYRSGTYIIELAMTNSGMDSVDLINYSTKDILQMASINNE